ncbi:TonB-dependent receptor [Aquabacter spiritensis]|uniref:Iron complex outermembrane receptor protein n=1 Tax=Aquabacter spiritensis TaxID=933073 RepID=A0A4R3M3D7_9HYPH|nr:TonB-dependent receptor [Aquabacter spiritensis]TCT05675.1 iron complex outermembrane receptor protein [Aquabacter spiritensis]
MTRRLSRPAGLLLPIATLALFPEMAEAQQTSSSSAAVELPAITVSSASPVVASDGGAAAFWNYGSFSFVTGAFVPVTVVGQRQIELNPTYTLGDVLFTQPGITSSTFAPGASRPIIRGLDSFRVKMAEDGIDALDVSTLGEDHAVPIDPLSTQRIEVIRGPATLRYGSQAIGGVVNAENNRIPTELTGDGYRVMMQGAGTTVDRGLEGAASIDARQGAVAFHADAFGRTASDYSIPGGGVQPNSFVRTEGQSVGLTYNFDQGYIGTALVRFASNYGIPGGEEAALQTNIDMEQIKWLTKGEFRPLSGPVEAVRFWTGLSRYHHNELGLPHQHEDEDDHDHEDGEEHAEHEEEFDPLGTAQRVHGTFNSKAFEGRVEIQHVPFATAFGVSRGALGFQINYDDLDTFGEAREFLAPARTFIAASYLFEEVEITPSTRFQAAGRIETVRINGAAGDIPDTYLPPPDDLTTTPAERSFVPVSVSLGLLQDLALGITGRLTAQYVERAPSALELYSKGAHHATGTFDIGNPDLNTEGAASFEIGFARTEGALRFDASAYYTRFDGFIYKQLTGVTCDEAFASCGIEDGEFQQIVYNQRNATFYGAEVKAQYDVGELASGIWGVEGQYDFVHATFSDGSYVPRMPPHRLGGGLYWGDGAFAARVNLLHAFAQDDVAAFENTTPGYNLLNAELSYSRAVGTLGLNPVVLTVGLTGTNLLDADIRNSASFKSEEVLLPGRNLRGFAKVTF